MIQEVTEKVKKREARVAVIGLGYVGLPLAVEIATAGFETIGLDTSEEKVSSIQQGKNYIMDVDSQVLQALVQKKKISATSDYSILQSCDYIVVCVPTPLSKGKEPDISYVVSAFSKIKLYLKRGQVIILESTTYPGTTEEVVLPMLQESGMKVGQDFYLAFSPERIDPGNKKFGLRNTPKVIGGVTPSCTEMSSMLYETFVEKIFPVFSSRTAEMVKILENTFRAINIGLANEVAIMCNHLNINVWEVIEAAATKPFGFMPFYPGPGLGGHCIPVDPHYLVWKLKSVDYKPRFIQLADEINSSMPELVVNKIVDALNGRQKAINGSKILVLGVSYKKDIDDYRESPSLDVIKILQKKRAVVHYHDPHVPILAFDGIKLQSSPLTDASTAQYDCVVLLTDHSSFDIKNIVKHSQLFVDTRNAARNLASDYLEKVFRL